MTFEEDISARSAPKSSSNVIAITEMMDSVVNDSIPNIPLMLRKEIIHLSSMAAFDAETDNLPGYNISWENTQLDTKKLYEEATKAAIEKFCELEGIKQEFKGDSYRLIGAWRKP